MRSDGEVLTVGDTVWRSDRVFPPTIPGSLDINEIHLLDYDSTGSYTFYFINDNGLPPHITSIQNLSSAVLTAAVPSIDVTFSKAIDLTTLNSSAVSLTLNGAPVPLAGLTFTDAGPALGGGETYQIGGLAPLTGVNGNYTLTVDGTKVLDLAQEAGDNSVSTSFNISTNGQTLLTSVAPISPDIRNTPADTTTVTFSAPINASSFNASALTLTDNGTPVALSSLVTVVPLSSTSFQIAGLSNFSSSNGTYVLSVNGALVTDTDGKPAAGLLSISWTVNTIGPVVEALATISPNPRNTIVQSLTVTLSEPIDPSSFTYQAVTVTQNGGPNLVTPAVTITEIDPTHYAITDFNNSFNAVTGIDGVYTVTVNGATLMDLAGNSGSGTVSETWTLNVTPPPAATNIHIVPDNGVPSPTLATTNTPAITIEGNVSDPTDLVQLTDLTTNTDLGFATVTGTSFAGAVALPALGAQTIQARVVDSAGNTTDATINVFIDTAPPMITAISSVTTPTSTPIDSVDVTLSKDIIASSFTPSAVSLTLNGVPVSLSGITVTSLGSDMWSIAGLSAFDHAAGAYVLTVSAAGFEDAAGNMGVGSQTVTWMESSGAQTGFGGYVYNDLRAPGRLLPMVPTRVWQVGRSILMSWAWACS